MRAHIDGARRLRLLPDSDSIRRLIVLGDPEGEPIDVTRVAKIVPEPECCDPAVPAEKASFAELLNRMLVKDVRTKPSYADSWILDPTPGLRRMASYNTVCSGVVVGMAPDGNTEYDVVPIEYAYPDELNALVCDVIEYIRRRHRENGGYLDRDTVMNAARDALEDMSARLEDICSGGMDMDAVTEDICHIAYRHSVGAGIFEVLLTDPHIEDVYVDAPCNENRIHVTMNGIEGLNSHIKCRTNLVADPREVDNLVNILKRVSGLRYCQSSPVMETDFPEFDARATVVGNPMSPLGDAVAIRKRSTRPWTLSRLVMNGTMSASAAGMLSFLIDNRCTMLVCGARGAGKSSLLSALMFEFPTEQRILTIEDTIELPGESMRSFGYKVQSILVDDRMNGNQETRAEEALRVSLRLGESAIVLGEVRGGEARTLYESMRVGRAGSSILGTIHGDSADSVYQRVVHDMGVAPEAFMATDIVLCLGTIKDKRTGHLVRKVQEIMATGDEPGSFTDVMIHENLMESKVIRRAMRSAQLGRHEIAREIKARALMRAVLADLGAKDERYLGPEWILMANDMVSKSPREKQADTLASEFRKKVLEASR